MSNAAHKTEDVLRLFVLATFVGGGFYLYAHRASASPTVGMVPPKRFIRHPGKHSISNMKDEIERLEKARRELFIPPSTDPGPELREWIRQQQKQKDKKK